jgi:hypothetical protein
MRSCTAVASALALALSAPAIAGGPLVYKDSNCRIAFSYPQTWSVTPYSSAFSPNGLRCALSIKPIGYQTIVDESRWDIGQDPFLLYVFQGTFNEAMAEMDFRQDDDGTFGVPGGYGTFLPQHPIALMHCTDMWPIPSPEAS